jgi:predicted Zn-dependent protease
MSRFFRRLSAPLLAACLALAPLPAGADWLSGIEQAIGESQHEQMVAQFGGVYEDEEVQAYVSSLGNFLAKTSDRPDVDYTFTVLDSPVINAFALPGGYVYVTRGLMALAENEAQLAGVLAHEIGHVDARHGLNRVGAGIFGQIASLGLGLLLGEEAGQFGNVLTNLGLSAYSREQEYDADVLGVKYLARAGYDPHAMAAFLENLQRHSRLEAEIAGQPGAADRFSLLATHPRTADRVEEAIDQAGVQSVQDPMTAQDVYLGKLRGLLYGYSPEEGFVRGRTFLHPELRFAYTVPQGYRLLNGQNQVLAVNEEGARIVFDRARPDSPRLVDYLQREWAGDEIRLTDLQDFSVDGMPAATGVARIETPEGTRTLRLGAVRTPDGPVYRFLFVGTGAQAEASAQTFRTTISSFRMLSAEEAASLQPYRLTIHTVQGGETVESLARRMPYDDFPVERFRVLNGLGPEEQVRPGQTVKLVTR